MRIDTPILTLNEMGLLQRMEANFRRVTGVSPMDIYYEEDHKGNIIVHMKRGGKHDMKILRYKPGLKWGAAVRRLLI